jgi:flavin-binding protein dodecin
MKLLNPQAIVDKAVAMAVDMAVVVEWVVVVEMAWIVVEAEEEEYDHEVVVEGDLEALEWFVAIVEMGEDQQEHQFVVNP